jgi:hypothetical protein
LQSNPAGGPPTVPQALNRYAATSLGQVGVGEAAGNAIDFASPLAWTGLAANLGLEYSGRTVPAKSGSLVLEGSFEALTKALRVGEGKSVFGGLAITPLANRPGWFRSVTRSNLGLVEYLGEGRFSLSRFNETLDTNGVRMVQFKRGVLLGEARALRTLTSVGLTAVIDVGFELYELGTGAGQWGNPYLTTRQKSLQASLVIGSDLALAGTLAFYGVAWQIAIPTAFVWALIADPVFTVFPITSPLYQENRNLQPLP